VQGQQTLSATTIWEHCVNPSEHMCGESGEANRGQRGCGTEVKELEHGRVPAC